MSKTSRLDEERRLISATQWQKKPPRAIEAIGSEVKVFLNGCTRAAGKIEPVAAAFNELLGPLTRFYQIDRVERGVLYVLSPAGPYLHQLKAMELEIVDKLNAKCPKAKIRAMRCNVNNS